MQRCFTATRVMRVVPALPAGSVADPSPSDLVWSPVASPSVHRRPLHSGPDRLKNRILIEKSTYRKLEFER